MKAFAAALTIAAVAWAAVPDAAAQSARLAALYPEGPVVIDGDLYVAEMTGHRVTRIAEDPAEKTGYRRETFFERDGCGPTALAEISGGRIAILCHLEGAVAIADRAGRLLSMIRESADGVRLDSPNDISADGGGGAFFSNAGVFHPAAEARGRVMRLAPDLTVRSVASGLRYANGVAVDPAGGRVLVSEHLARQVLAYRLSEDGERLSGPVTLIDFKEIGALVSLADPLTGPDGIEIAPDGAILVAIYGGGAYLRLAPDGRLTRHDVETRYLCSLAVWGERLALAGAFRNDQPPYRGLIDIRSPF